MATRHELKTWTEYFHAVVNGNKTFELRKADRDFKVGDTLVLREWDNEAEIYTGQKHTKIITYILKGGQFGLDEGYVIMGLW